jgi:HK97 family phage prohead protease
MGAIGVHHTEVDTGGWDGPANESRLKSDGTQGYYRKAFAWQDPDGDAETKAAYRFIHHVVSSDGTVGGANLRACSTGIGVLNGGRGGTTIPASDKQGVWNHLAAHLRDGDMEPPELKRWNVTQEDHLRLTLERLNVNSESECEMEVRDIGGIEVRAEEGKSPVIQGYAAVFNTFSQDLGGFTELIEDKFFDEVLDQDVRALFNHDANRILGRSQAGTLRLKVDERGLAYEIDAPESAKDVVEAIRRGDITGSSFAFAVLEDWWGNVDGQIIRRLVKAKRLFDVSPVVYPAYQQTSASLRSVADFVRVRGAEGRLESIEAQMEAETIREQVARATQAKLRRLRRYLDTLERWNV